MHQYRQTKQQKETEGHHHETCFRSSWKGCNVTSKEQHFYRKKISTAAKESAEANNAIETSKHNNF